MADQTKSRVLVHSQIAICLILAYALSFPAACFLLDRKWLPSRAFEYLYAPLLYAMKNGPPTLRDAIVGYAALADGERPLVRMLLTRSAP